MQAPPKNGASAAGAHSKKRQAGPQDGGHAGVGRPNKRAKARADRNIPVQGSATDAITEDGDVNLPLFLDALQSSIDGLETAMCKSKASGTKRAFQQVPRDMRRRTASHNPKRVPGRLRARAKAEMASDNTPLKGKKKPRDVVARVLAKAESSRRDLRQALKEVDAMRAVLDDHCKELQQPSSKSPMTKTTGESRCLEGQFSHLSNALDKTRQLVKKLQVSVDLSEVRATAERIELATLEAKKAKEALVKTKKLKGILLELKSIRETPDPKEKLGQALSKTKKLNKSLGKLCKNPQDLDSDQEDDEQGGGEEIRDDDDDAAAAADDDDNDDGDVTMGNTNTLPQSHTVLQPRPPKRMDGQLPTHLWHAKRCKMSTLDDPFFSKPTPIKMNTKTVRKIHRAYNSSAFARDASHRGFVQISGPLDQVKAVLKSVGVNYMGSTSDWIRGCRVWMGNIVSVDALGSPVEVTPARAIWNPSGGVTSAGPDERQVLVEIEQDTINVVLQLLSAAAAGSSSGGLSRVTIRDLSSKLGCIDMLGPGSGQKLMDIIRPLASLENTETAGSSHWSLFKALGQVQPSMLGYNICLGLSISFPDKGGSEFSLLSDDGGDMSGVDQLLAAQEAWASETHPQPFALMDQATRKSALKVIRSKQGAAGSVPDSRESRDTKEAASPIPIIVICSTSHVAGIEGKWTVICQRELVKPLWLRLVSQKGRRGGEIGIACVEEMHRIHTELGVPFFPVDFPQTIAGAAWELKQRDQLRAAWEARPKGKRTNWDTFSLEPGNKGEHGSPFACDWEHLVGARTTTAGITHQPEAVVTRDRKKEEEEEEKKKKKKDKEKNKKDKEAKKDEDNAHKVSLVDFSPDMPTTLLESVPPAFFGVFFRPNLDRAAKPSIPEFGVTAVRIRMLGSGVPHPRARVYCLPNPKEHSDLYQAWLGQFDARKSTARDKRAVDKDKGSGRRFPETSTLEERKEMLAKSLFQGTDCIAAAGGGGGEETAAHQRLTAHAEDLIGFATSGGYNLAKGRGHGLGHLSASKIVVGMQRSLEDGRPWDAVENFYCLVRNVGETVYRPAVWRFIEEDRARM